MTDPMARARELHQTLPVVDGHNDLPWEIRVKAGGSLEALDPRTHLEGLHTDFDRLRAGGVGVQFWSVYVPAWARSPLDDTLAQIDLVEEMSALAPDRTEVVRTAAAARRVRASGRLAGIPGAEGGHAIEGSLDGLRTLAERGVRYMTLTHGSTIEWADSATDEPRHGGLTEFGRQVVREMNRLGVLVDVSHTSANVMRHAVEESRAPVIASHSCAFALAPHPRNVPDDVIEAIAAGGGVVMVTFVPAFLVPSSARKSLDMFEEQRRLREEFGPDEEAAYDEAARELFLGMDLDRGSVSDVADHIEHITRLAGVDHVGIGGDFDGVDLLPVGLEDVSCYPNLTAELLSRGWHEPDLRKLLGENALRALEQAEAVSR